MADACRTKKLNNILVQENGIIRNEEGYLIGRLSKDIDFNSEHIQGYKKQPKEYKPTLLVKLGIVIWVILFIGLFIKHFK